MPLVYKRGGIEFWINRQDHNPPHLHVTFKKKRVKIVIKTLRVVGQRGFRKCELEALIRIVEERQAYFLEMWEEYK